MVVWFDMVVSGVVLDGQRLFSVYGEAVAGYEGLCRIECPCCLGFVGDGGSVGWLFCFDCVWEGGSLWGAEETS